MESGKEKHLPQIKSFQSLSIIPLKSKNYYTLGKGSRCLSSCPSSTVVHEMGRASNCHLMHIRARVSLYLQLEEGKHWHYVCQGLSRVFCPGTRAKCARQPSRLKWACRAAGKGKQHNIYFHKQCYDYAYETQTPLLT